MKMQEKVFLLFVAVLLLAGMYEGLAQSITFLSLSFILQDVYDDGMTTVLWSLLTRVLFTMLSTDISMHLITGMNFLCCCCIFSLRYSIQNNDD